MIVLIGIGLGWIVGVAFAVIAGPLSPYLARERPGFLSRISENTFTVSFAIMFFSVAFMWWGIVGAIMGTMHNLVSVVAPVGALGNPNIIFSLGTVALTVYTALSLARRLPWARRQVWSFSMIFMVAFAWVLPILGAADLG